MTEKIASIIQPTTRRNLLGGAAALTSAFFCACGEAGTVNTPPPVGLQPAKPVEVAVTPEEAYFDHRFDTVIAKGKELEVKFPKQFAGAGKITQRLKELVKTAEISVDDDSPQSIGIVRKPVPYVVSGVIKGFNNRLAVGGIFFNLQPEIQVMTLLHELGHYDDFKRILKPYIGKPSNPNVEAEYTKATGDYHLTAEMKELFRNCQQLEALKSINPNFSATSPAPFEIRLLLNSNRSMYETYQTIKSSPKGYQDDIWRRTVTAYLSTPNLQP